MTQSATPAATFHFDTAAAEAAWSLMSNSQRAAWVSNLQANADSIPTDQLGAVEAFFAGKVLNV